LWLMGHLIHGERLSAFITQMRTGW
jgi:hypothetical protein